MIKLDCSINNKCTINNNNNKNIKCNILFLISCTVAISFK